VIDEPVVNHRGKRVSRCWNRIGLTELRWRSGPGGHRLLFHHPDRRHRESNFRKRLLTKEPDGSFHWEESPALILYGESRDSRNCQARVGLPLAKG